MPRRNHEISREEPPKKRRRVCVIYSDSDESEKSDSEQQENEVIVPEVMQVASPPAEELPTEVTPLQTVTLSEEPVVEVDAELLAALGDPVDDVPEYGEKILHDLAQRWLPLLRKGIPKEKKETLMKDQTIPENCKLLRAPTLNAEISAAISDVTRIRDKRFEKDQNQLGLAVTAVSRGLSLLLTGDDKRKKIEAIKSISDGCRILADLHYVMTQARLKLITPGLDKAFLHVLRDVERDEKLFGSKLSEKIKASKAIEKQGLQIKKNTATPKSLSTVTPHSTNRILAQGNWTSSSRQQSSNRGGRGGMQRYGATTRKAPMPTTSTSSNKQPTRDNSKQQRAQTR